MDHTIVFLDWDNNTKLVPRLFMKKIKFSLQSVSAYTFIISLYCNETS